MIFILIGKHHVRFRNVAVAKKKGLMSRAPQPNEHTNFFFHAQICYVTRYEWGNIYLVGFYDFSKSE